MNNSKVLTKYIELNSNGENDIINITSDVKNIVYNSKLKNGIVVLFVEGSTASITTIEYEPGLIKDFPRMLERIVPKEIDYEHNNTWHDGNGHSHTRASLIGPSLTIPVINSELSLGIWQQIVFLEMDIRARKRKIVIQLMGED
ncbi:MAG: secondary thiamine-phosphate synthase enzyme YjbQ [Nitrososphaeraceae archaeon]